MIVRNWAVVARRDSNLAGPVYFASGARTLGLNVVECEKKRASAGFLEAQDVVVVFGLQDGGAAILDNCRALKIPTVVVDYGYVKRASRPANWSTGYWQVSLGGLNRPPTFECLPDRWDALDVPIALEGGDRSGYALLCVQTPNDQSHGLGRADLAAWARTQAYLWRDLVVRPHPESPGLTYGLPVCKAPTLQRALEGARLVVTGNSNSGHEALIAGVPVVAAMPGAAYEALSGEVLPSYEERLRYFRRVAFGQWTWIEMLRGDPVRFLLNHWALGSAI